MYKDMLRFCRRIFSVLLMGERKKRRGGAKNFQKGECCCRARRQILGRDLRIQILALVRVRKTDCRIRAGKREFRRNVSCFLFAIPPPSGLRVPRSFRP